MTAEPSSAPALSAATTAAIRNAARTVAAPTSSHARLQRRDGAAGDRDTRQKCRPRGDGRNHETAVALQLDAGLSRRDLACGGGGTGVAARRQPGGFPSGIDAAHLQRDRGEAGQTDRHDRHKREDGERRLDGRETRI